MAFRHEWKEPISEMDRLVLRQRLGAVMETDPHAVNGGYAIRSLYFDNLADKALREKVEGFNIREKFRIRYYNGDLSHIRLEKKSKINGLCSKVSCPMTPEEVRALLAGEIGWMLESDRPLLQELYAKMKGQGLRPKTIVDYWREPYIYRPGNVRVTLDSNIRTGMGSRDFLNPDCVTVPVGDVPILMEVKWDAYLPAVIRDLVQLEGRRPGAFSKYAVCRIYG